MTRPKQWNKYWNFAFSFSMVLLANWEQMSYNVDIMRSDISHDISAPQSQFSISVKYKDSYARYTFHSFGASGAIWK